MESGQLAKYVELIGKNHNYNLRRICTDVLLVINRRSVSDEPKIVMAIAKPILNKQQMHILNQFPLVV
jgi:hypothetical protein